MKNPSEYNVRAVERALQILDSFDDLNPEKGVTEIAQIVGLHKATAHRIITTLLNYGYIERASDDQKYRLGLKLAELGLKVLRRVDLRNEALPLMNQLSRQLEETSDLCVFDQGEVFYLDVVHGNHALTIAAEVGKRLPAHCTASGKLFLAYLSSEELDTYLENHKPLFAYTENTITSPDELRQQLEAVRQQGYGFDNEEFEVGIRAISAPIRNHEGTLVAAISMPSPAGRMTDDRVPEIAETIIEATNTISRHLGWQ